MRDEHAQWMHWQRWWRHSDVDASIDELAELQDLTAGTVPAGRCPAWARARLQHTGQKYVYRVFTATRKNSYPAQSHGGAECHVDGAASERRLRPEGRVAVVRLLRKVAGLGDHGRHYHRARIVGLGLCAVIEELILQRVVFVFGRESQRRL